MRAPSRYQKVPYDVLCLCKIVEPVSFLAMTFAPLIAQVRDINSGTFGFVELAMDKLSGQHVAIKFIDRGDKVQGLSLCCIVM